MHFIPSIVIAFCATLSNYLVASFVKGLSPTDFDEVRCPSIFKHLVFATQVLIACVPPLLFLHSTSYNIISVQDSQTSFAVGVLSFAFAFILLEQCNLNIIVCLSVCLSHAHHLPFGPLLTLCLLINHHLFNWILLHCQLHVTEKKSVDYTIHSIFWLLKTFITGSVSPK